MASINDGGALVRHSSKRGGVGVEREIKILFFPGQGAGIGLQTFPRFCGCEHRVRWGRFGWFLLGRICASIKDGGDAACGAGWG